MLLSNDKRFVIRKHKKNFHIKPNLNNPSTFNENISKILLQKPTPLIESCVDKYKVREFVSTLSLHNILNDHYGYFTNSTALLNEWNNFPKKFVIKATHGCGWNFICKDKENVNIKNLKKTLNKWLRDNFYYHQREQVYKYLKPGLIVEKYLEDESGGLMDYKIHCFNGEPKFINVIVDRFNNMKLNSYDIDWNFLDVSFDSHYPNDPNLQIDKPKELDMMIEYAKILSSSFKYVRVDFYLVNGKIYFGELTFTPGNGAYTSFSKQDDLYFGKYFKNSK